MIFAIRAADAGKHIIMEKPLTGYFGAEGDPEPIGTRVPRARMREGARRIIYRTDRICVVVSGTWWVESGADFTPQQTVPVAAGGYVLRHARTWHYDGVPADGKEPAMIAVFGIGPVDIRLADPAKPSWRQV